MRSARKSDLVAITAPPSAAWISWLHEAWEAEAAVLPVDHRLPRAEVDRLIERARPTALYDGAQFLRIDGEPVDSSVALVVATSGSAGTPKFAELPHYALRAAIDSSAARLGVDASDPWLCCLPVAHMGGMLVMLRAAFLGAPVFVYRRFKLSYFADRQDANCTSVVPTMLARLIDADIDLEPFRAILVGGAPMDERLRRPAVVPTYGMTEACGGVVYDGRPLDGVDVRIAEGDEIQMAGTTVMRGYRLTDEQPFTPDGWLRTHDAGVIADGRLRVLGRLDDVIVTGGEKVWPEEVEEVLRAHPQVADVAVVGRPDPEWGARVTAVMVPSDPTDPPSLDSVRAYCHERIAGFKAPHAIEITDTLPRTPSGKIQRGALQGRSGS
ncbi:MAG: class I adenylate-forming enzyme family protein [Actinomycetota bacterium]